ncbi:MAG: hypothetical protein DMG43_01745 [Acidobacteria bacterium]|nr:MAG: hypothetical protein DMG43_01745 [Acidobacteriota bacterium]
MTIKETLLVVWIFVMVGVRFFFGHFWGCTVYALEKAVAFGFVSLPVIAKFAAGIFRGHVLS